MTTLGPPKFDALAAHLAILASATRLELLHALRRPKLLHEIRVGASLAREDERPGRPLSRQTVAHHLDQLARAGLVRRVPGAGGRSGDAFVLSHERLFALVHEMRALARLRPGAGEAPAAGETMPDQELDAPVQVPRPRLVVAFGRDDGAAFGLGGPAEASWRIGRGARCEVRLDYDAFLSAEHAILARRPDGFVLRDAGSKNGTWVNWEKVRPATERRLDAGDLVLVGRTVLALQP